VVKLASALEHSPRITICFIGNGGVRFREPVCWVPDMASAVAAVSARSLLDVWVPQLVWMLLQFRETDWCGVKVGEGAELEAGDHVSLYVWEVVQLFLE